MTRSIIEDISNRMLYGKPVTDDEVAYLVRQARDGVLSPEDAEDAVLALGGSKDKKYKEILEKYLCYPDNTSVSIYALVNLCRMGFRLDYKPYILEAGGKGFDWDPRGRVAGGALYEAGNHLVDHVDKDFAQLLFDILDRHTEKDRHRGEMRERSLYHSARMAACIAMGADPEKLLCSEGDEHEAYAARFLPRFLIERRNG